MYNNYSSLWAKDNTQEFKYLIDVNGIEMLAKNGLPVNYEDYVFAIRKSIIRPIFKLYQLNYDETIKEDITPYLLSGGSLDINYNSGQRRTLNITLMNHNKKFNIHPHNGVWKGAKYRFDIGVHTDFGDYIKPFGVFVPVDPDVNAEGSNRIVSLKLVDKFASVDSTIGGSFANTYTIPTGSNIYRALVGLLGDERMNGKPYDMKTPIFPRKYMDVVTPHKIVKSSDDSIGSILLDFATILNCQVYYNEYGRLVYEENEDDLNYTSKSPIWHYNDTDLSYSGISIKANFAEVANVVTVTGANINGAVVSYTLENKNPSSPTNILVTEPKKIEIVDENIASEDLARQRCKYELFKKSLLPISANFQSLFLPHLDVNKVVTITNEDLGYNRERFLIESINYPIGVNSTPTLTLCNTEEVSTYVT